MTSANAIYGNGNGDIPKTPETDTPKYNISLLLIDHYDSFTYNLYDYFAQLLVEPPLVIAKDAYDRWNPDDWSHIDAIVLSPGPGSPQEQPPLSHQAIQQNPDLPILGVCLGHQLLAIAYNGTVGQAPIPIHGQDHWIATGTTATTDPAAAAPAAGGQLFQDLPSAFRVVRYHSLAASNLPDCLQVTATSKGDNVIQGMQHTHNPHYGVQFHPESIGTQHGLPLLENFCRIVQEHKKKGKRISSIMEKETNKRRETGEKPLSIVPVDSITENNVLFDENEEDAGVVASSASPQPSRFQVAIHKFSASVEPQQVFDECYADQSHAVWLDSSSSPTQRGTMDILAAPASPEDILEYHSGQGTDILSQLQANLFGKDGKTHPPSKDIAIVEDVDVSSSLLQLQLQFHADTNLTDPPFEYRGGYLGYLGYEVRLDTERYLHEVELGREMEPRQPHVNSTMPTAAFFLARQSLVYHHPTQAWYMVGLMEQGEDPHATLEWMKTTKGRLLKMDPSSESKEDDPCVLGTEGMPEPLLAFLPNRPKETYEQDIADCHKFIRKGDSYELCLTNKLEAEVPNPLLSTFQLYKTLRKRNPAPYSAYIRWNMKNHRADDDGSSCSSLAICCSSPERFMSIQRRQPHPEIRMVLQAEAKPIKGTCARVLPQNGIFRTDAESREDERRARSLELSLKDRAENLMIVDLLRNDMSRVCQVGSVHVAKLMAIESFATVHQMVSTIRGTLPDEATSIDLLRASFPGGSMTGAPKIRTMELLEELENNVARGPYAGSLGYLSVNGCMDMNIIIRSAVVTPTETGGQKISIGAGGAITALSETQDEYDEMLLKARAVVQSVQEWASRNEKLQPVDLSKEEVLK
jgi:para-aminobenzoate synthetase